MPMIKGSDEKTRWMGKRICDLCQVSGLARLVDGKTIFGPWAVMCKGCHEEFGLGFGEGLGQLYEADSDGELVKVAG